MNKFLVFTIRVMGILLPLSMLRKHSPKILMLMKLIILLTSLFSLSAFSYVSAQKINLSVKNKSFVEVLELIQKQAKFDYSGNHKILKKAKIVSLNLKNESVENALSQLFKDQPLQYVMKDNILVIKYKDVPSLFEKEDTRSNTIQEAQQIAITGRVEDKESKQPITGATISFRNGKFKGQVQTDASGSFKISNLEKGVISYTVSMVGYSTFTASINIPLLNAIPLTIPMTIASGELDQVVVVAYGTSKVKDVTGSMVSLGKKEIENTPMGATVQSLLQGKASGVNVAIQSASPTSPISVIIRGASSLSGDNQPLWVIDGVPDYSTSTSGNITNSLYNLNLNDIQSIDILKDASATALYGSRAANGVVVVTTKKGVSGQRPTIELSSRFGYQAQDFNGYRYMNTQEYKNFIDKASRESILTTGAFDFMTRQFLDEQAFFNLNTTEFDANTFKMKPGAYTEYSSNWIKEMTQNPLVQQHDLSLRGGNEDIVYYSSLYANGVEGIIKSGKSQTYGGKLNVEAKIRKSIKFGLNLSGSTRKTDDKDYMLTTIKNLRPDVPPFNADGSIYTQDVYKENPYTTLKNTISGNGEVFNGTGFLEYTLLDGLMLRSAYTANYTNGQNLTYYRSGSLFNENGERKWNALKTTTNVWENTLTFAKAFGKHDVLALMGYSMEKNKNLVYSINATDFPDDDILNNFTSAATRGALGEEYTANALVSQFARVQYKFNGRYILSATIRNDGSSRFGPNKRWGIFPSGAAAWLITEEDFFKGANMKKYISYLKFRISAGKAGSQNLGNYAWRSGIGSSRYNESSAISPVSIGNALLQWEETQMADVGLDYGFWDERVRGTFGFYLKDTDKLLYSKPLAPSTSFSNITSNVASVRNKGIEFDISVDVIKKNDLTFSLDFNASKNTNRVMEFNGADEEINFSNNGTQYMKVVKGGKTGQWYGYQTANRFFATQEEIIALQGQSGTGAKQYYRNSPENPGDLYFIDQNKDSKIDDKDRVYLGTSDPKFYGGFGATFLYKNWHVNTTFIYAFGHKRLWEMPMNDAAYVGDWNQSTIIAGNSATLKGPIEATFPRMTPYGYGANDTFSDFWLHDASFLRLNALNINYRLPSVWFGNKIVQGVHLTFQATNLFTLTKYPGYDPQGNWSSSAVGLGMGLDGSNYPSAKNFNFGVKVTFK